MRDTELINRIEKSMKEGFKEQEIIKALREDGYQTQRINKAIQKAETNLESTEEDTVPGIDLTGKNYVLKQSLIRNKYKLYQKNQLILKAKQKLFKLKEEIPFKDPDGKTFMHAKAENILDTAGDYTLIDSKTEEPIVVLEKNWSFLHHKWKIKEPSNQEKLLAKISSRGGIDKLRFIGALIPYLPNIFALIPHKYDVENPEGKIIGKIEGRFALRDIYDINIETENAPQESVVAATVAIDALEKN